MLDIPIEKWNLFLREVYNKQKGTLRDLEEIASKVLGSEKIKIAIKALLFLGFIKLGLDSYKNTTWEITPILKEEVEG
jgi:hypothetical protein